MSEIKCEVIRDLMPLVADDVASAESKQLVDGHMENCEVCRAYFAGMSAQLARMALPEDGPTSTFVNFSHKMEKRVRMKKVIIALVAAVVALCVVVVGGMAVFDQMATYYPMPIEQVKSWLWRESNGDVNLMIRMMDGYGWYNRMNMSREGNIMYLTPQEPSLKLWNKGHQGGWNEELQLDLIWEDDQLYYSITVGESVFNEKTDRFDYVDKEIKIPIEYVRWGYYHNYTTIYEVGDVIPTMEELQAMVEGLGTDEWAEIVPYATVVPQDEPLATPIPFATPAVEGEATPLMEETAEN